MVLVGLKRDHATHLCHLSTKFFWHVCPRLVSWNRHHRHYLGIHMGQRLLIQAWRHQVFAAS